MLKIKSTNEKLLNLHLNEVLPHVEYVVEKFYSNWYECAGLLRKKLNDARKQLFGYETIFKEVKEKNRFIRESLVVSYIVWYFLNTYN